jgi:hypothetical protein
MVKRVTFVKFPIFTCLFFDGVLLFLLDCNHRYVKFEPIREEIQTMYATDATQITSLFRFKIMLHLICLQPPSRHHYSSGAFHTVSRKQSRFLGNLDTRIDVLCSFLSCRSNYNEFGMFLFPAKAVHIKGVKNKVKLSL